MREIRRILERRIGKDRVFADELTLVASAPDAGCYRKTPKLVVRPHTEQEVIAILETLHEHQVPVTFRAAGTSLSGQAVTDSVLLQARGDHWNKYSILENGRYVRTQPGITGNRLNQVLAPFGRKFGPDPASVNSAMVGGIIANNAAGMSCGIHASSYATIRSARIILPDGTLLDTSDPESRKDFLSSKAELASSIASIRDRIRSVPELAGRIRRKYRIKNTTGYGMNSFLDYDDPVDIILHLLVGSEGTLGFVSEATFETVPLKPFRASSLIYFTDLESAAATVPFLREARAAAIEIMDRQALRSVQDAPGIPGYIRDFGDKVTALLIDLEADSRDELDNLTEQVRHAVTGAGLERDFELTTGTREIAAYWNVRKGIFPAVGGMRRPGTSVIIEDVAVEMEHLVGAVKDLRQMLDELGYADAVIYGHALDGNLHFIFSQDFQDPGELERYDTLLRKTAEIIAGKYNGSLKAEHGTGLNMAPFVSYEWGKEIHGIMREIKNAFDPRGILNPGVLISDDPRSHMKNLKTMVQVHESVDKCIECGFCEVNCLSAGYTLSARQRIVVSREIEMLKDKPAMNGRYRELVGSFRYAGDKTCAGDGLCAVTCPLSIDTGNLVRHIREERNAMKPVNRMIAGWTAAHFGFTGQTDPRGAIGRRPSEEDHGRKSS
jgi:D-lactate dehydrogenase